MQSFLLGDHAIPLPLLLGCNWEIIIIRCVLCRGMCCAETSIVAIYGAFTTGGVKEEGNIFVTGGWQR